MLNTLRTFYSRWFAKPASKASALPAAMEQAPAQLVPYDENLLERSRTQWQFGDWESLANLDIDCLQHHPDRAKLALLAAAGRLQTDKATEANHLVRLAQNWGISKNIISRILIAGVHNSIGRAAAIDNLALRAYDHFEQSIILGAHGLDTKLLAEARSEYQYRQLGIKTIRNVPLHNETKKASGTITFPCNPSVYFQGGMQGTKKIGELASESNLTDILGRTKNESIAKNRYAKPIAVKVFGTLRSGTNYFRALVEWNYDAKVIFSEDFGWKHGLINDYLFDKILKNKVLCVCIIKNPLASLVSIFKYYNEAGLNINSSKIWELFLREKFVVFNHGSKNGRLETQFNNPIDYWNTINSNLSSFCDNYLRHSSIIRYEDLLSHPLVTLNNLSKKFELQMTYEIDLQIPKKVLRRMSDIPRKKADDYLTNDIFNREFYDKLQYLEIFSESDLDFVRNNIDVDLLKKLGYSLD